MACSSVSTFISGEPKNDASRRYHSGRQVLDEALAGGRLVTRYRNCSGQVVPEMHLPPNVFGGAGAAIPAAGAESFRIGVNGAAVASGWAYAGFYEEEEGCDRALVCTYMLKNESAGLEVSLHTLLDGTDFIIRWLEIRNIADKSAALTEVTPLSGYIWHGGYPPPEELITEGAPFEIAYNHNHNWGGEGDFYFEPLPPGGFRAKSDYGKSGWSRPACWLRNRLNGETFVCEFAWSGNWEFQAAYASEGAKRLAFSIGMLSLDGEALRVIKPGECVETPKVHFGLFRDSDDAIVQATHMHVRRRVLPALPPGVPVSEIEANHRGYLCDRETEEGIKRDIDVAKESGAELYVVDAGWFGAREENQWWNNVGDWQAGPWMANGFEPVPEYAHGKGMRFGLWVEIEAFGAGSAIRGRHGDWIMTRHGMPCAGGRALDLANPEVEAFCLDTICGLTEKYRLDMYRIDHNHSIGLGGTRLTDGYVENTLWLYYEAFYRIFRTVRERYPDLVLQNCAGGGGRLDWGTMGVFHNTELSDWMRQPRSTRILNGVTMSLPPEILLRTFGTEVGDLHMDGDMDAQLRICMLCRPIYRGIAPSLEEYTPYLLEKVTRYNKLYVDFCRVLLKDCLVFHHTPFQKLACAHESTILEYASPDRGMAMLAVFTQSSGCGQGIHVRPRGLSIAKTYRVTFGNTGESVTLPGFEIAQKGIIVDIGHAMSSELVIFNAV